MTGMTSETGLEIRRLRAEDERLFRAAVAEAAAEVPPWPFAFGWSDALSFPDYVRRVAAWERGESLPEGFVPAGYYVAVVDGEIAGRLSVRFELNEYLAETGGHIGYAVRAAYRGRGYATAMLREALRICAARGMTRALVTCHADNAASRKVIERCGGVFERTSVDPGHSAGMRRYWVTTT